MKRMAWLRWGPNQRKKPSRVLSVRIFPIHSSRLVPSSIWYTTVRYWCRRLQYSSSIPSDSMPSSDLCSRPHLTAISTERKTFSQVVRKAEATSLQLIRLAQPARNQA